MPTTIPITVYGFDELGDAGKERARAWYRETAFDYEWYTFVFNDFEIICGILGIELRTHQVPLVDGGKRDEPQIFFTGFASQGDGACFEGSYSYLAGSTRAIRAHAPRDTELHRIADALRDAQRRHFYQLRASVRHRGRYCHEYSMEISVARDRPDFGYVAEAAEQAIIEALRDLARWLYRQLEREFEYLTSELVVDHALSVRGFTFLESGKRFG